MDEITATPEAAATPPQAAAAPAPQVSPAPEPPVAVAKPTPAPATSGQSREFDPALMDRTLAIPGAMEYLKDKLGVDKLERSQLESGIREARSMAVTDLGLTKEQAAQIPGETAEQIWANATFTSQQLAAVDPGTGEPRTPAPQQAANAVQPQPVIVPAQFTPPPSGPKTREQLLEEYKQQDGVGTVKIG